jgi:hypothetical protein
MPETLCQFCGRDPNGPACFCYDEYDPPEAADVWLPCCVCRRDLVCVSDGYDTCGSCLSAQEPETGGR